jgi:hypothetical protein
MMPESCVDQSVDWLAHATERKQRLNAQIQQAANRLKETKVVAPPPPIKPPPPVPKPEPETSVYSQLIDYVPSWRVIQLEVCAKYGVTLKDIHSDNRRKNITIPRQEMYYRMRHEAKMSLLHIGMRMKRDHTSVMNGIERHAKRLEKEAKHVS